MSGYNLSYVSFGNKESIEGKEGRYNGRPLLIFGKALGVGFE